MDRISKLPAGIIETILCLLPIQEAVRTSILSREWRYQWIKIPKLEFNLDKFEVSTKKDEMSVSERIFYHQSKRRRMMDKRCKLFYAIYQVLLMHQGPIHEFTLVMDVDGSCVEIAHIILHLSKKNTVKILKLDFSDWDHYYMLPISIFSLHQLTELYLKDCFISHKHTFSEFGCLTITTLHLHFDSMWTYDTTLLWFLSSCPSLKRLTLVADVATIVGSQESTMVDLFKCLPVIEYLSVSPGIISCFVPQRLPTKLIHLKCLCMEDVRFSHKYELPFLVFLVKSSPNLEKLKLSIYDKYLSKEDTGPFTLEGFSDIMFKHLKELDILNSINENLLDLVKLILAKSPILKKVRICLHPQFDEDEISEISKDLSCFPRASPMVKINVRNIEFV